LTYKMDSIKKMPEMIFPRKFALKIFEEFIKGKKLPELRDICGNIKMELNELKDLSAELNNMNRNIEDI